jgi:hypothetical protein
MDWSTWAKMYTDIGVGAFFATLFVGTIWTFWKDLKEQRKVQNEAMERMIKALDATAQATNTSSETMGQVKRSMDEQAAQTREFIAYLRGRDGRG